MLRCRYITPDERERLNAESIAAGGYRDDFPPGSMWSMPWYQQLAKRDGASGYLSVHYMRDWLDKRAPLVVRCPDGTLWCVDSKSTNGDGWKVTGEAPNITCEPSILVKNYHGYLRGGVFTPDLDGRTYPIKPSEG